ncbi:MAG: outer membrane beta-barrel family protein [Candidatus Marinimicrobia bacterium]|nr:outer membrane beta-barrel family protein [Candidatus Neomarinimicrobiota bacterium]
MKKLLLLIFTLLLAVSLPAATLSGLIKDIKTNKVLEFANVAVYINGTENIITGTMSGIDGTFRVFNVPAGDYYLVVSYMGYEQGRLDGVTLNGKNVDVGTIMLTPTSLKMENVIVEAEKPAVTYKIDKRVIDASQFLSARGGTAIEILENVPSVDVDIEGNVSLRGSSDFTVMIDGRPSVLEPQDALESIPAASIENIEIMTNASAKYEAEGGAGIINIVTRRDKRIGITGLASVNAGTNNLGANVLLNYTNEKITAFISVDYNKRNFTGASYVDRFLYYPDTTAEFESNGIIDRGRGGWGIKGGLDWFISKNDVIGFSVNYGPRLMGGNTTTDYMVSYSDPITGTVYNSYDYTSYENLYRGGNRYSIIADYTHKFPKEEENTTRSKGSGHGGHGASTSVSTNGKSSTSHQIKFEASYSNWNMDEESFTYLVDEFGDTTEGQQTTEIGPSNSIRGKIEYTRPLNKSSNFETGVDAKFNWKSDGNDVYYYNPVSGDFDLQNQFSNYTAYKQNTISGYILYSGEFGLLGFQPGLRAEYTYREIDSDASDSVYVIDRLHIFPTLHMSYQLPGYVQLMASYTRRISRPRGWQLEPFYTWRDAYNIRVGNPGLVPEMIDSYDFSVQKSFGKNFVSLDAFCKRTANKIERIQTVYGDDVILSTYENVGTDQSMGVEVMSNLNIFNWWMMNISGRLYYYQVSGELYGEDFDESSLNYSARLRNTFMLNTGTRIQFGLNYRSASATAQGSSSGGLMTDLGIRQDFFDGVLSATLQVRDIFGTGFHQYEVTTPTYHTYSEFYRDAPMISLDLSLKINNYKKQPNGNGFESDGFNSEDGGDF